MTEAVIDLQDDIEAQESYMQESYVGIVSDYTDSRAVPSPSLTALRRLSMTMARRWRAKG